MATSAPVFQGSVRKSTARGAYDKWPVLALASVLLFWYSTRAIHTLLDAHGDPYKVFGSFWISGWAASHHLNPYGFYSLTWHVYPYKGGPLVYDVNLSPPCMLPVFQLLARFPLRSCIIPWTFLSALLFVTGTTLLFIARRGEMQARQILWLLLSTLVIDTLWFGQDYALLFLLACFIWLLTCSERMTAAGVCIGILLAIKPNLVLWPALLFFAGYKKPAIVAGMTAAALTLLAALIYGPGIYRQWLNAHSLVPHHIFTTDISFVGIFTRLGHPAVGVGVVAAGSLILLLFVHRVRPLMVDVCGLALCAGILCAPLAWHLYVLFAAPFFAARRWARVDTLAAILMALPPLLEGLVLGHSRIGELAVAMPHLMGVLIMTASFLKPSLSFRRIAYPSS
jgi:hypothetical protein